MESQKLAIIVLGKPNSGKSTTWYSLFGRTIRTGWKRLDIDGEEIEGFVKNSSFEEMGQEISMDVFVRNASFEEYGDEVETYFNDGLPNVVFCSVQYIEKGVRTIEWFKNQGYFLYIQWLNPGYRLQIEYDDFLRMQERFEAYGRFQKVSGKESGVERVRDIRTFLASWVRNNYWQTSVNDLREVTVA
ncbi:MAG: hypothetical protein GC178_16660 [Flavobacteriales bacterium]|nr:hypothetical protein [Flavobacteriales bacterium]